MPVLFILYAGFLVVLSAFKSAELFLPTIHAMEVFLGGDKWMHLLLAVPLSLMANLAAESVMKLSSFRRILLVMVVLVLALLMDELHQQFIASRRFDWQDSVWGSTGLLLGCAIYVLVKNVQKYVTGIRLATKHR